MGVNRGTVANWEQGLAAISLPMAMRWFTCCGVSVARYMDACIHPGLLEHLEDDLSDLEKRRILIDAMMECSSDRKSTRLNSSHTDISRMPSSA